MLVTLSVGCGTVTRELLPSRQRAVVLQQPRPERVGAARGAGVEHRVGNIRRRNIDLVAAGLRHAVDHKLATGQRAVGIPQLKLLIADEARIGDRHQVGKIEDLPSDRTLRRWSRSASARHRHGELLPSRQRAVVLQQPRPKRIGAARGAGVEHRVGNIRRRNIDLVAAGLRHAIDHKLTTGRVPLESHSSSC